MQTTTQKVLPKHKDRPLYFESAKALDHVEQRGCGFSFPRDLLNLPGHIPMQPALGEPALVGGVGLDDLQRCLPILTILSFCEYAKEESNENTTLLLHPSNLRQMHQSSFSRFLHNTS